MKTVKEVCRIAGVSARTLHHYDAVGLLKPAAYSEAGYRLYDDAALGRLQSILLFRELKFSLKEIKGILDDPAFDREEALKQQIKMLELQLEHISGLISFAREIQQKGTDIMNFDAFDKYELDKYSNEVRERWGGTDAYEEYRQKTKNKTKTEKNMMVQGLMAIFSDIGSLKHMSPEDAPVQEHIGKLQRFITENYYECTGDILHGLGSMYTSDQRMKENIDKAGGEGTAEFTKLAIEIYTKTK